MDTKARIQVPLDDIKAFAERWGVEEFALFGSVLRDDFSPDSDVDVIVTFKPGSSVDLFGLVQMEEELKIVFGRSVDLVTAESVESSRNYIRKREILRSMEKVYDSE